MKYNISRKAFIHRNIVWLFPKCARDTIVYIRYSWCIAYDGADYREQLRNRAIIRRENSKRRKVGKEPFSIPDFHPVVTLVLYFGDSHWQGSLSLKDHLRIPEGLEDYVPDYHINLVEVAFLEPETVHLFKSDFRFVSEFLPQSQILWDL